MDHGTKHANHLRKNQIKIGFLVLLIALCIGAGWVGLNYYTKPDDIMNTQNTSAADLFFPVYFPHDLPAGFKLDETSVSRQSNVTGYQITDPKGKKIFVAQQRLPEKTVTEKFEKETLVFPENVTSPLGEAVYGSANGQLIGSIKAQKTWILVTADRASEESLAAVMVSISVVR